MGLIKAALSSARGTLGDQWLEAIEPLKMDNQTLMCKGVKSETGSKGSKNKGSDEIITDGSLIKVDVNQTMLLVDGGKIVDYSAEPGYFTVKNGNAPSMLEGDFQGALSDAFNRFKFAGNTPYSQRVMYINTQEIQDIPFGTPAPLSYFDSFYNADLAIRANGYYNIRIENPIKFYTEMVSKHDDVMTIDDLQKSYNAEFLTAFQTAIGKMAMAGERISFIGAKATELADHMTDVLDEKWLERRGIQIVGVGINSLTYDEASNKLLNMRSQGAMLQDQGIRDGYMQGSVARGIEAAGSNEGGSMTGFMGVGSAMNMGGSAISAAGAVNANATQQGQSAQPQAQADNWNCSKCGQGNVGGKFCANCGTPRPEAVAAGFCKECGKKSEPGASFCNDCGAKL